MNASQASISQLESILRKVAAACPSKKSDAVLSDIYFMPVPEECTLIVSDDDGRQLFKGEVAAWQKYESDDFYTAVQSDLQEAINRQRQVVDDINFLRPFSFVLVDEDHETLAELYLVDDDTVLLSDELMAGLEDDLDAFLKQLMEA